VHRQVLQLQFIIIFSLLQYYLASLLVFLNLSYFFMHTIKNTTTEHPVELVSHLHSLPMFLINVLSRIRYRFLCISSIIVIFIIIIGCITIINNQRTTLLSNSVIDHISSNDIRQIGQRDNSIACAECFQFFCKKCTYSQT